MYTEDEARKKWCPSARVCVDGFTSNKFHETHEGYKHAKCMASECMEWRWSGHTMLRILDSIPYNDSEVEQFMKMRKRLKDSIKDGSVSDPERGYCGLGGAPRG